MDSLKQGLFQTETTWWVLQVVISDIVQKGFLLSLHFCPILAAFGAAFGILYRALTLTTGGRRKENLGRLCSAQYLGILLGQVGLSFSSPKDNQFQSSVYTLCIPTGSLQYKIEISIYVSLSI